MNPWIQITGWTLIHFVWQGGLLALATAAGLQFCRRAPSATRYAIACTGLTAMLASPVMTAAYFSMPGSRLVQAPARPAAVGFEAIATAPRAATDDLSASTTRATAATRLGLEAWLPSVVWSWLAGVALLLVRFAGGCWRVRRLRTASFAEAVSPWQLASERLASRLGLKVAFRVVESRLVDAPAVLGWIRPVVLLPLAGLTNLAPAQIEAILAHELAHIRRRDYAVNLLQTFAETLLFYHPGVWWVSARIREEREHCCDDVAVKLCGEPVAYAAALMELASWRTRKAAMAVGATDGSLLARVRRLMCGPDAHEPRLGSGLTLLALAVSLGAGLAAQSPFSLSANTTVAAAQAQAAAGAAQASTTDWHIHLTDHFEIYYPPDLDVHAERVGREAERAYERVSSDLKHNLAFRVDVILFHTTNDRERTIESGGRLPQLRALSSAEPSRILLAMDHPAELWYGLITHEVAHVFLFDIVPGTATPRWIAEGLADYQRGTWDPADLVTLREAVRSNLIPKISGFSGDDSSTRPRMVYALGHAAFDFMESRWGKPGVRQFIFWLRQTATSGGDPYERALKITPDEFDRAFEQYLRQRFAGSTRQTRAERFDRETTIRIEGDITSIDVPVSGGLACMELWVEMDLGVRQRWAVECGDEIGQQVLQWLQPGDHVIVVGPPARTPATQRVVMHSLVRPSDGFTWR